MLTTEPARILRLGGHGLALRSRADLVVWDAASLDEAVGALAPRAYVIKSGRVTVEHRPTVAEPWRN
jgi:imidazolonepropionase-like amidohydrolase